jgi:hypothetical protein
MANGPYVLSSFQRSASDARTLLPPLQNGKPQDARIPTGKKATRSLPQVRLTIALSACIWEKTVTND